MTVRVDRMAKLIAVLYCHNVYIKCRTRIFLIQQSIPPVSARPKMVTLRLTAMQLLVKNWITPRPIKLARVWRNEMGCPLGRIVVPHGLYGR
jgi:hypothetical protein